MVSKFLRHPASGYVVIGAIILGVMTLPVMAVDYFADGCIVGDRYYVTTQIAPGVTKTEMHSGSICRQMIIRTKRGDERRNVDY